MGIIPFCVVSHSQQRLDGAVRSIPDNYPPNDTIILQLYTRTACTFSVCVIVLYAEVVGGYDSDTRLNDLHEFNFRMYL